VHQLTHSNQSIFLEQANIPLTIGKPLGAGAQGEVYQVAVDDQDLALKWYFPKAVSEDQKTALRRLIEMGPPSDRYLWPIELAVSDEGPGFGFVMPLREQRFRGIVDIYSRRVPVNMWVLSTLCLNLVDAFSDLHSKGYCYKDIKSENVFFDPDTGDVCICDCDNITIDGESHQGILGTLGYSAPEIDRGEASPTIRTDLHSLAVLIFKILHLHHPLEGIKETAVKCLDLPARRKIYGTHPIFIFDPQNKSNRPDPVHHRTVSAHWPIYPKFLKNLFTQAFTVGLKDPDKRVRETVWRKALSRLRDSIVMCRCGAQSFFDFKISKVAPKGKCWRCKKSISSLVYLRVGKDALIVLNQNSKLYPHHLVPEKPFDFSKGLAEVVVHPKDPQQWGLKNLSEKPWVVSLPDGSQKEVPPGRSVGIGNQIKVHLGTAEGTLCYKNTK